MEKETYHICISNNGSVLIDGTLITTKDGMSNLMDVLFDSKYVCTVFKENDDEV